MADSNLSRARKLLAAKNAPIQDSIDPFEDEETRASGAAVKVSRSGYGWLPVYKLTPNGVVRIRVAVQSINQVLNSPGYAAECFDCGRDDCLFVTEVPGEVSTNICAGKAKRQYRVCPVRSCRKPIYDPQPTGAFKDDEFDHSARDDSDAIQDDAYNTSTPETRTKAALDIHVIGFHPQEAMEMGIHRQAELPRMAIVS